MDNDALVLRMKKQGQEKQQRESHPLHTGNRGRLCEALAQSANSEGYPLPARLTSVLPI